MTPNDFETLIQYLPFACSLKETHISWVILGPDLVYKIRKPIRYPFLDFSTLEKRKADCEKELVLNRRFSPEIYLSVIPIRKDNQQFQLGGDDGEVVDYAVVMKRLDNHRQLDELLRKQQVTAAHMEELAITLATFHHSAERIYSGGGSHLLWLDFADLLKVESVVQAHLGDAEAAHLRASARHAHQVIQGLGPRVEERLQLGFTRDVHGDLHSRNIFLLEKPVLFDCLEFNDHLRQVDLLSEIAFLGMDLHAFDREDLWKVFLETYQKELPVLLERQDHQLLNWYRWYRANVRLKVNALRALQDPDGDAQMLKKSWDEYLFFAFESGYGIKMNML